MIKRISAKEPIMYNRCLYIDSILLGTTPGNRGQPNHCFFESQEDWGRSPRRFDNTGSGWSFEPQEFFNGPQMSSDTRRDSGSAPQPAALVMR